MATKKEQITKASKGYIDSYYKTDIFNNFKKGGFGVQPEFSREKILEAIRKDSTVIAAITTLVDKSVENGWRVEGYDKRSSKKEIGLDLRKMRFNKLLRQILYNLYAYNNVFIENVKDGNGKIKELHVLETTITQPISDEHGTVTGYQQNVSGKEVFWKPDEVTHIALNTLTTGIWGELDIQSIYTSILIKQYIMAYIGWLMGTNQLRGFFNIKNASDKQIKDFLSYLKRTESDITKPLIAEGDIDYQIQRQLEEGKSLLEIVDMCDNNILMLLQVPPVLMGKPDQSNRSNSDTQEISLFTRIVSIHRILEDSFEFDLFPKIGYEKIKLLFNPINKISTSRILENAERIRNIGADEKTIDAYLKIEGFPIEVKFKKEGEKETIIEKKSEDMYPSRKRKLDDEISEKIGSGAESTTREEQLIKKGGMMNSFNSYTPIIEQYEDEYISFKREIKN